MANGHGGQRTPNDPAPVSGPGALARRTDGGPQQAMQDLPNAGYGEGKEYSEIQRGAPMSATPGAEDLGPGEAMGRAPMQTPTPLTHPTDRPDEPISHGAPFGPGPGPSRVSAGGRLSDTLARLMGNDPSGGLQDLYEIARRKGY